MKFSFPDEDIFRIEEDELVTQTEGIEACECVVFINPHIALIEAKASSPQINNRVKFEQFISSITQKFSNSLQLFNDIKEGFHGEVAYDRLPINLKTKDSSSHGFLICLIIHGHQLDWLLGLQDAFRDALQEVVVQWHIKDSNVKVLNEEIAIEKQLIVAYIPKEERDSVREPNGNMDKELARQWFESHYDHSTPSQSLITNH